MKQPRPTLSSHVLAIDLGGTKLACAVIDGRGKIRSSKTEPVDTRSPKAAIEQMTRIARELGAQHVAAGVAVPGLARRNGTVWAPNLPGWERMPLARMLRARLGVPVAVESDRNAVVLGESWRGAARGKNDVVVLIVGTGIGAGILSGGRLVRGAHELSGCAGWMVVTGDDTAQSRKLGSLEAIAAGPGVAKAAVRARLAANSEELAARARAGDRRAQKLFAATGEVLGLAVANLVSLFDPEVVVLTGGLTRSADLFLDELRRTALARCQPLIARQVKIRVSRMQARANLLGAARLAWALT